MATRKAITSIFSSQDDVALTALGGGDKRIRIAILDGPVDTSHPCFVGADLVTLQTFTNPPLINDAAVAHGTHVASIIFGQPGTSLSGVAPHCRGLIIPIFASQPSGEQLGCSQLDLARAILIAVENGATIINVSGGQLTPSSDPHPILAQAIETCARHNVLIVAAAGNDGCDCLHIPAAVPSVLAVGAMDRQGQPLALSNWGAGYLSQGILAPGMDISGAIAGTSDVGGKTGTSFAAPIVSGIAALLAGLQLTQHQKPDPHAVRAVLLRSAVPCRPAASDDCRRYLSGRLNVRGAVEIIQAGDAIMTQPTVNSDPQVAGVVTEAAVVNPSVAKPIATMSDTPDLRSFRDGAVVQPSASGIDTQVLAAAASGAPAIDRISPSDCGCGGGNAPASKPALVYALGKLGYDFGSEARRDSFIQAMAGSALNPVLPSDLLAYLANEPHDAASIIWTLNLDATPIYAIQPAGPFAALAYEHLREFLRGQMESGVELVSIPGLIAGSVRLMSGQVVPVIVPVLRGMYSWAPAPLAASILGARPEAEATQVAYDTQLSGLTDFLSRVYYDLRNLGVTAEERALNYSATNAVQVADVIRSTTQQALDLDKVTVRKSPVCRPDSECYDVELSFFHPQDTRSANRVFRFTVDVSDVIPVTVGAVRSWTRRE